MKQLTSKLIGVALALALFACGAVAGIAIARTWMADEAPTATPTMRGSQQRLMRRFQRRLELTPEQTDKIARILERSQKQAAEIRRRGQAEIQALLTPEQKKRYQQMIERMNERRAERRKRWRERRERRRDRNEGD